MSEHAKQKTHYRRAFNSPYLSSADVVGHVNLTIREVRLEPDKTKRTKDRFNTAYFVEREIRPGETLKPMILNATNSKTLSSLAKSSFIEDWAGTRVTIYTDSNVRFGRETVEGLRISPHAPEEELQPLVKDSPAWENAKNAYKRDGNLDAVRKRRSVTKELEQQLIKEVKSEAA